MASSSVSVVVALGMEALVKCLLPSVNMATMALYLSSELRPCTSSSGLGSKSYSAFLRVLLCGLDGRSGAYFRVTGGATIDLCHDSGITCDWGGSRGTHLSLVSALRSDRVRASRAL